MKKAAWIAAAAGLAVAVSTGGAVTVWAAAAAKAPVTMVPADLKWVPVAPDAPPGGPEIAVLHGDLKKGPVGFFIRMKSGSPGTMHSHTSDYNAVVIQGTIVNAADGDTAPRPMPPGSYWFQPGKAKHITSCNAGADCIAYVSFTGKFDFVPATPPAAAK
ncbi:MAG TPA: DUF4437 domain-containing protein [Myxococcota bacterium]|jgi:hypothetical protein|nr:DUF4437 domain-containing protein [Myxococcota bacterium]